LTGQKNRFFFAFSYSLTYQKYILRTEFEKLVKLQALIGSGAQVEIGVLGVLVKKNEQFGKILRGRERRTLLSWNS